MSAEFRNCENCSLGVLIIVKDNLDDLTNHPSLVQCTVDVEDRDGLDELLRQDFILSNVALSDEQAGCTAVDEHGSTLFDA